VEDGENGIVLREPRLFRERGHRVVSEAGIIQLRDVSQPFTREEGHIERVHRRVTMSP
jgi:hypothetical protein